jgi:hypothetical protein
VWPRPRSRWSTSERAAAEGKSERDVDLSRLPATWGTRLAAAATSVSDERYPIARRRERRA